MPMQIFGCQVQVAAIAAVCCLTAGCRPAEVSPSTPLPEVLPTTETETASQPEATGAPTEMPTVMPSTTATPEGNLPTTTASPTALPTPPVIRFATIIEAPNQSNRFGDEIAVSNNTLIVTSPRPDQISTGAAYIYTLDEQGSWGQPVTLTGSLPETDFLRYGTSVAIDGDVAVVGAGTHPNAIDDLPVLYVYRNNGGQWIEEAQLSAWEDSRIPRGYPFGHNVRISGNVIVAPAFDDSWTGAEKDHYGGVYVYRFNGSKWLNEADLFLSGTTSHDFFGIDAAIEGDTLVISSRGERGTPLDEVCGSAYIYRYESASWLLRQEIVVPCGDRHSSVGRISLAGRTLAMSLPGESVLFVNDISEAGDWSQTSMSEIKAPNYLFETRGTYEMLNDLSFAGEIVVRGDWLAVSVTDSDVYDDIPGLVLLYHKDPSEAAGWKLIGEVNLGFLPGTVWRPVIGSTIDLIDGHLLLGVISYDNPPTSGIIYDVPLP